MLYKVLLTAMLVICTGQKDACSQTAAGQSIINIPYGKDGVIAYNLQTGLLNITQHKKTVFTGIGSSASLGDKIITSAGYKIRKYNKSALSDGFGKGTRHVISLSGEGLPAMQQVFYTYPSREYFMMETTLRGTGLRSNRIIPFEGRFPAVAGDARTLFMPFDNDAFVSYNAMPFVPSVSNISAEAGVVYDNDTRGGFVIGSVEHEVWKTGVRSTYGDSDNNSIEVIGGYVSESLTRDRMAHGTLSGNLIKSSRIFAGSFTDWRSGLEEYAKANRIAEPPYVFNCLKPVPVGWNSWGVIQEKLSLEKVLQVTAFIRDSLPGFRTGGTAFIDLDSYWDNMLLRGQEDAFIQLKKIVADCLSKGLQPGIYWAPFTDWGAKSDGSRKAEGSAYTFGEMWTRTAGGYHDFDGARALDPTHPGTRQRIAYMMGRLKECGFRMIKIDFLGHAAIESDQFYDPSVTTGMQAYRKGMEYLIDQAGSQMLIYAAISPNLATGRYAHTRRVACDAFKSINDTRYTLNSLTYGWWQTWLYNYIDADHVVLGDEKEGVNRARFLSSVITGTVITGDDFSAPGPWRAAAIKLYQNKELLKVIQYGKAFKPVEGNTDKGASELFIRRDGDDLYLALFNYTDSKKQYAIPYSRLGLPDKQQYEIRELLQDVRLPAGAAFSVSLSGADAALYKIKLKKHVP